MQVTEADQYSSKRVGVAEHLINFKSSPNFKNMKKFIRSKMDLIEKASHTAPDPPPPPNVGNTVSSEVQPPLPLEPPPPDEIYSLNVKKELDDSKFENGPSEEVSETQSKEVVNEVTGSQQEPTEKPKETICRDFIRGSCKRPGTCRYAHKFDLSQLVGVYTFCRKYQTSVCTYPICKYVHASVFEEHHFYRTGVLPPHAFAHHKKNNVVPPTVPPQQPQDLQNNLTLNTNMSINLTLNTNMSMNLPFTNPPPPIHNETVIIPHGLAHHTNINQIHPLPPPPPPPPPEVPNNFTDDKSMSLNHPMIFTNPPPPLQNEISQLDSKHSKSSKRILLEHQNNIEPYCNTTKMKLKRWRVLKTKKLKIRAC
nr:formin-like protein 20 isoform X2 [Danaus plexippus plexippus]